MLINEINTETPKISARTFMLKGIPSSPGMAMGPARTLVSDSVIAPDEKIKKSQIDEEISRLEAAINDVAEEYESVIDKIDPTIQNVAAILETNIMILRDPLMIDDIKHRIASAYGVESSVAYIFDMQKQFFLSAKDSILRERAFEIENIKERLLSSLRNQSVCYYVEAGDIVVAKSVTPSDLVHFKEVGAAGIITEVGGITAHCSILARSFEIPAIIGVANAVQSIPDGENLIVNGYAGWALVNPGKKAISTYQLKKAIEEEHRSRLGELKKLPSETKDGYKIKLMANIDIPKEVDNAVIVGAEGVGLVRSENLIMTLNHFPNEREQLAWYSQIADRSYPNTVTFRAFDIGSDKYSEGIPKHESNPALGFRGIRFLLQRTDIFTTQIKAILKASKNKNVRLMLPMITNVNEVIKSKELIEQCKVELIAEGAEFDTNMPVGIMIETPSAALMADNFAKYVQFFSIGSNDLTQYTVAADRTNELVLENFDSFHPAVLKLIKYTANAAKEAGISVSVCGEIAGHSAATSLLIGMGISELSVSPSILLELKSRVRDCSLIESQELANKALKCDLSSEIMDLASIHTGM
jgi:phosphotransferase system enzyme I (PtsI)